MLLYSLPRPSVAPLSRSKSIACMQSDQAH